MMGSPVRGQLTESPHPAAPAATHTTRGALNAVEVISTSSQLVPGRYRDVANAFAQAAFDHVDLADAVELVAGEVEQHQNRRVDGVADVRDVQLVHLERADRAERCSDKVAMMPASMLAPSACVATSPSSASAAATIRVVVDLPLVPVISAVRFPAASRDMICGSIFSAIRPPIIDPLPRPAVREASGRSGGCQGDRRARRQPG